MSFIEIYTKIKFCIDADRIGPDIPFTHFKLHFKKSMRDLCISKFKKFGKNAEFRPGAYAVFCSQISIGENVVIRPNTMIFADQHAQVIIEDNVMLGAGVHFYVNNHKYSDTTLPIINQGYFPSKKILLKAGCWIGANVVLLPGVIVGKNSVVGAGSIVTKSVPDNVVVAGNPAKILKEI